MMKVKVAYYGLIRNMPGSREEEISLSGEATVRELLHLLAKKYGDEFRASILTPDWQLQPLAMIHLNDCNINEIDGLNTKLEDGSQLSVTVITYAISGG